MNTEQTNQSHYAVFGCIIIPRGFCPSCRSNSFIENGKFVCCQREAPAVSNFYKRECEPQPKRRTPHKLIKEQILQIQNYRCFYCQITFGNLTFRRGKPVTLKIQWEHFEPFSFSQNNEDENFVAACQICNGIKSDLNFQTVEEAQIYVQTKRESKGYIDALPELSDGNPSNSPRKKILFPEVSDSELRENAESSNQRPLSNAGRGANVRRKSVNRSQKNQKRRTPRSQNRKSSADSSQPVAVIPFEIAQAFRQFSACYHLSRREFAEVCGFSKSSVQRLLKGEMPKTYFASVKSDVNKNVKLFLLEQGRNQAEIETELDNLFKPLPIDSEQIITVEKGLLVRYFFKDRDGKILHTLEIQG